jgi:hypothetical protein
VTMRDILMLLPRVSTIEKSNGSVDKKPAGDS